MLGPARRCGEEGPKPSAFQIPSFVGLYRQIVIHLETHRPPLQVGGCLCWPLPGSGVLRLLKVPGTSSLHWRPGDGAVALPVERGANAARL